ncbi:unnamed protein product, partial [Brachionus calyciflorus]
PLSTSWIGSWDNGILAAPLTGSCGCPSPCPPPCPSPCAQPIKTCSPCSGLTGGWF